MTNLLGANLNNGAAVGPQGEGRESPSRFPAYPAYKDSGVEWLGEVPEHWEVTKLSYVTSRIGSGKTPSGGAATYASSGVPFIRSQNVHDQGLRLDDIVYIDEETDREMAWSRVRPLDVLINITGASIGRSCQVPAEFGRANVNQHVCVIRLDKAVEASDWVAWFMKSPSSKEQVKVSQTGAAREGLNFEQLAGFYLCMSPLNERKVITAFLDHETARIDALIEEQQRLIELLKEKRQAVISHAVTKGLDPAVPMKDSGVEWLGEVPAHWEVTKFKWPLRTASGGTPPSNDREAYYEGEIPWLRSLDLTDDLVTEYEVSVTKKAIEETSCKIVPKKSVLIAMYGGDGTIGKNGLLTFDSAINQAICAFLPSDRCLPEYLHRYIQFYRPYWMIGAESSRKDPNIGQDRIGDHFLLLSPLKEQQEIVDFVSTELLKFTSLVNEAQIGVELLHERRSALISAAVTGKIDVRGWQPPTNTQAPELAVAEAV